LKSIGYSAFLIGESLMRTSGGILSRELLP